MDKKWSFYKSVCIIDISCIILFILFSAYNSFSSENDNSRSDNTIIFTAIVVIFSTSLVGDLLGIRLVNKLPEHTPVKKGFRNAMVVFYILLLLFFALLLFCDYQLVDEQIRRMRGESYYYRHTWIQILLSLEFVLLSLTSLYKVIFTWKLVKAVQKNHIDFSASIDTIGTN